MKHIKLNLAPDQEFLERVTGHLGGNLSLWLRSVRNHLSKNKYNYQLAGKRDKIDLTKEEKIFANFQLLKIKSHIKLALLLINIVVLLSLNNDIWHNMILSSIWTNRKISVASIEIT